MRFSWKVLVTVCLVAALAVGATAALAYTPPKPATGQWKTTDTPGGFRIVKGTGHKRNKLYIANFHLRTTGLGECGLEKAATFTAFGRFPLKSIPVFERKYEHVWGVGRYGDEEIYGDSSRIASVPARIKVNGKIHHGAFKMDFSPSDPSELIFAGLSYGPKEEECLAYAQLAAHQGRGH